MFIPVLKVSRIKNNQNKNRSIKVSSKIGGSLISMKWTGLHEVVGHGGVWPQTAKRLRGNLRLAGYSVPRSNVVIN